MNNRKKTKYRCVTKSSAFLWERKESENYRIYLYNLWSWFRIFDQNRKRYIWFTFNPTIFNNSIGEKKSHTHGTKMMGCTQSIYKFDNKKMKKKKPSLDLISISNPFLNGLFFHFDPFFSSSKSTIKITERSFVSCCWYSFGVIFK